METAMVRNQIEKMQGEVSDKGESYTLHDI